LWKTIQTVVDNVVLKISLKDLLGNEEEVKVLVNSFVEESDSQAVKN